MDKIISLGELTKIEEDIRFVRAGSLTIEMMCSYCLRKNLAYLRSSCRYCGASLEYGWRMVGKLENDILFVSERELNPHYGEWSNHEFGG